MNELYFFREIKKEELKAALSIIKERIRWMDEVGIKQWNVTDYEEVYPLSYYEECRERGEIFVLVEKNTEDIVALGALKGTDPRWVEPKGKAFYLHHLASSPKRAGAGSIFLSLAERYAKESGIEYFRLDSALGNEKLEEYYTSRGYIAVGECIDGKYIGVLREKKLS